MNYSQLVQDVLDGKESASKAFAILERDHLYLCRAINQIALGAFYERSNEQPDKDILRLGLMTDSVTETLKSIEVVSTDKHSGERPVQIVRTIKTPVLIEQLSAFANLEMVDRVSSVRKDYINGEK